MLFPGEKLQLGQLLGFIQNPEDNFERDLYVKPEDGSRPYFECGAFPKKRSQNAKKLSFPPICGGFRNETNLKVPAHISSLLSYGPKFVFPPFTLVHPREKGFVFNRLVDALKSVDYTDGYSIGLQQELRTLFLAHYTDDLTLTTRQRELLAGLYDMSDFLAKHRRTFSIVEGDKGKLIGLMTNAALSELCWDFLKRGLSKGMYANAGETLTESSPKLMKEMTSSMNDLVFGVIHSVCGRNQGTLYVSPTFIHGRSDKAGSHTKRFNEETDYFLTNIEFRFPSFRPTIKYHKDPVQVRPVISKCGSISIGVGTVIKRALERLM